MSILTKPCDHWNFLSDDESEEHLRWLNQTENLSTLLFDNMKPVRISDNLIRAYDDVKDFQDFVSLVHRLGWVEHTNDWDNTLNIGFMDGTSYQTNPGYYEFEIDGADIVLVNLEYDDELGYDDDEIILRFPIDNIRTMALTGP